ALTDSTQHEKVAQSFRNAQAARDGACVCAELAEFRLFFERADDRRTTLGLNGNHFGAFGADPSEFLEFFEWLPHAHPSNTATSGIENPIRQIPAKLFGSLKTHRFLAFNAIRLLKS